MNCLPRRARVPGTLRTRYFGQTHLKNKRYLAALTVIQPEIVARQVLLFLKHGRCEVGQGSVIETRIISSTGPESLRPQPSYSDGTDSNEIMIQVKLLWDRITTRPMRVR